MRGEQFVVPYLSSYDADDVGIFWFHATSWAAGSEADHSDSSADSGQKQREGAQGRCRDEPRRADSGYCECSP